MLHIERRNQQRADGLSSTLQIAKAAEHLVCSRLLIAGHNAFLADAGLPYDVIVDRGSGRICRIQVKATTRMYERAGYYPVYRFAMRRSRTGQRAITLDGCDMLAFAALDRELIAWFRVEELRRTDGRAVMIAEFKTREIPYVKRSNRGGFDPGVDGRFIEDFAAFDPDAPLRNLAGVTRKAATSTEVPA